MAKLSDVNAHDLRDAIALGCQTMGNIFNADDNHIGFFGSSVYPEARLSFSPVHSESHIPGRHLNGLLNAEAAAGIRLDEQVVERHAAAAFFSYSGPTPMPLNRALIDGPLHNFHTHNIREGFHALYAVAAYRGSQQALDLAAASIDTILQRWSPNDGWDSAYFSDELGLEFGEPNFIVGVARAIGPLVKLYRATGLQSALELAVLLAQKTTDAFFTAAGTYDRETFGAHTHSVTCVMSSLAQLADLQQNGPLLERVRAFYDNGLWDFRDALGWVLETTHDDSDPDRGEINNTGDIVETALILGRWGYTDYYQDAERILRGHMLPAQLRDTSFISEPENPANEDGRRDMARRHRGAFGFPAPYGHQTLDREAVGFNMDIVGGGVGSLCEAYREAVRTDRAGHWVNLFFDRETDAVQVESPYTHNALKVRVKKPGPLYVRQPSWAKGVALDGADKGPIRHNGYWLVANPPLNRPLTFRFALAEEEITLHHRTRRIRARLQGDRVVAMENFGANFTFFDPLD